ncbi:MAG: FeoA family protein [bacterium]
MIKRISELKHGETGCISSIARDDALGIRLMEMGLVPGTTVKFLRLASHRGPLEIFVRGYRMTLGLTEAQSILIEANS